MRKAYPIFVFSLRPQAIRATFLMFICYVGCMKENKIAVSPGEMDFLMASTARAKLSFAISDKLRSSCGGLGDAGCRSNFYRTRAYCFGLIAIGL